MAEWFKAPVLKTGVDASPPWVRIPLPPPPYAFGSGWQATRNERPHMFTIGQTIVFSVMLCVCYVFLVHARDLVDNARKQRGPELPNPEADKHMVLLLRGFGLLALFGIAVVALLMATGFGSRVTLE
jgi:hypothetical protein